MKKISFVFVIMGFLSSHVVEASICTIHFNRTACAGKETDSYKKCDGKKECDEKKKADSLADCQKLAADACSNSRLTETKSKVITAMFEGKAIKSSSGNDDFCVDYKNRKTEFDQCK